MLHCTRPGEGIVCQGWLTPSDNPEKPRCMNGSKPKNHPNALGFAFKGDETCFIDSTARIGLCDPIIVKAIEHARKSPHPEAVHGWKCPNDPDPTLRFENPCLKVGENLSQCGLDQWVAAVGGCDDLKAKYPGNPRKAAEECMVRWFVTPTVWSIKGPCTIQPLEAFEAQIKVNDQGCIVTSCTGDGRNPNACKTRTLGEKN